MISKPQHKLTPTLPRQASSQNTSFTGSSRYPSIAHFHNVYESNRMPEKSSNERPNSFSNYEGKEGEERQTRGFENVENPNVNMYKKRILEEKDRSFEIKRERVLRERQKQRELQIQAELDFQKKSKLGREERERERSLLVEKARDASIDRQMKKISSLSAPRRSRTSQRQRKREKERESMKEREREKENDVRQLAHEVCWEKSESILKQCRILDKKRDSFINKTKTQKNTPLRKRNRFFT